MPEFTDTLRILNAGAVAQELTDEFAELVAACNSTRKQGTLTVTLKLKPGRGESKTMEVEHEIKLKAPAFDRPADHLFIVNGNALVLSNPDQKKLDLREVRRDNAPLIDGETGEIFQSNAA